MSTEDGRGFPAPVVTGKPPAPAKKATTFESNPLPLDDAKSVPHKASKPEKGSNADAKGNVGLDLDSNDFGPPASKPGEAQQLAPSKK
jgi:hypothetical protein